MRLPDLTPAELDEAQRALRTRIEAWAHERVGRAHAFCVRLLDDAGPGAHLDDETYAAYAAALGTTTMTELVVLVGYYRTLADLLAVYDVGVPEE